MPAPLRSLPLLLLLVAGCSEQQTPEPAPTPVAERTLPPDEQKAPEHFHVLFETTAGDFTVEVHRHWSPNGADRFYTLLQEQFYDEAGFFRVVPNFVVQFGLAADPQQQAKWEPLPIADDTREVSNERGTLTFATSGPDTRTTQIFINLVDNARLDNQGFTPFGKVVEGMESVDNITARYGEKPSQGQIQARGNVYLKSEFPDLDYVKTARIVPMEGEPTEADEPTE